MLERIFASPGKGGKVVVGNHCLSGPIENEKPAVTRKKETGRRLGCVGDLLLHHHSNFTLHTPKQQSLPETRRKDKGGVPRVGDMSETAG